MDMEAKFLLSDSKQGVQNLLPLKNISVKPLSLHRQSVCTISQNDDVATVDM